jgi:Lon protease-like protein
MFPIGTTMLPASILQLHVFEPRYRALMSDVLAAPAPEFGVVLIARGREVGGGDQRHDAGCVATVLRASQTPDGRYAVMAGMGRRIRVVSWLVDDPYPCADVEDWPDDPADAVDSEALTELARRTRRAAALAVELGDPDRDQGVELSDDPVLLTYQLAWLAPLGDADRHDLLCAGGAGDRTRKLAGLLDEIEPVLQFRLQG